METIGFQNFLRIQYDIGNLQREEEHIRRNAMRDLCQLFSSIRSGLDESELIGIAKFLLDNFAVEEYKANVRSTIEQLLAVSSTLKNNELEPFECLAEDLAGVGATVTLNCRQASSGFFASFGFDFPRGDGDGYENRLLELLCRAACSNAATLHALAKSGSTGWCFKQMEGVCYFSDDQHALLIAGKKFPAFNNVQSDCKVWPEGVFDYDYPMPHNEPAEKKEDTSYGLNGNYVFKVPGRTEMGIHSGRKNVCDKSPMRRRGPEYCTLGCIRTTDEATEVLRDTKKVKLIVDRKPF
jgi:hypothetical protein